MTPHPRDPIRPDHCLAPIGSSSRGPPSTGRDRRADGPAHAMPMGRVALVPALLGAIWLPSALIGELTGPSAIAVNLVLTAASVAVLAGRRRDPPSGRSGQRRLR
jgi:hypothetical protein